MGGSDSKPGYSYTFNVSTEHLTFCITASTAANQQLPSTKKPSAVLKKAAGGRRRGLWTLLQEARGSLRAAVLLPQEYLLQREMERGWDRNEREDGPYNFSKTGS